MSVFTLDDVVYQARNMLQDTLKERYTDQHILAGLNVAVSEIKRIRPDIIDLQGSVPSFPYSAQQLGTQVQIPVEDMYFGPLISFTVGWAELADDEFAVDNRAATLLGRFTTQLMVGG